MSDRGEVDTELSLQLRKKN